MAIITIAKAQECYSGLQRSSQWSLAQWTAATEWATEVIVNAFIPYGGYSTTATYFNDLRNVAAMFSVFWLDKDPDINKIAWDELNRILAPLAPSGQDVTGSDLTFMQSSIYTGYARRLR
jgi:hypothetical protein